MHALTKIELSQTYLLLSVNFVVIVLLGEWLLSEPMPVQRAIDVGMIVLGPVVAARG